MLFAVASDFGGSLQALSTGYKTILAGLGQTATLRRGKVTEMEFGAVSDPGSTDCNIIYTVQKQTANDGTATIVTPNFYEPLEAGAAPTAGSLWKANYTAEPTTATRIFSIAVNQHSAFAWFSPDEVGLQWAAVNNQGLGFLAKGATVTYTGTVLWSVKFYE